MALRRRDHPDGGSAAAFFVTGPGTGYEVVIGVNHGPLTAREWEVATWIAKGLNNGEIAKQLDLSRATVASHVTKILKKLRCGSRVQVAVWVTEVRLQAQPAGRSR